VTDRLELDETERRALGVLLEKALATPTYYPMTLNAVVNACNQRSNRHPVLALTEADVEEALQRLRGKGLSCVIYPAGGRVEKWRHLVREAWELETGARAVLAELLLRGVQSVGELRARASRMHRVEDQGALDAVLSQLAEHEPTLARRLSPSGQRRGVRWCHELYSEAERETLAEQVVADGAGGGAGARQARPRPTGPAVAAELEALRRRLARIEAHLGLEPEKADQEPVAREAK